MVTNLSPSLTADLSYCIACNLGVDNPVYLMQSHNLMCVCACACVQINTGYRVEVVTVRKLEFETDSFAFADKVRSTAVQLGLVCGSRRDHAVEGPRVR